MSTIISSIYLPNEILLRIFLYLDGPSILSLRLTCHCVKNIVDDNKGLQYCLELFASGLVDGLGNNALSADERMQRLLRHRCAWDSLTPNAIYSIPKTRHFGANLTGGWFTQISEDAQALLIDALPAPCCDNDATETLKTWTLSNLNNAVSQFAMDPTQDLAVIMRVPIAMFDPDWDIVQLRILSISDGTKHPLATQETLRYSFLPVGPALREFTYFHRGEENVQLHQELLGTFQSFDASVSPDIVFTLTIWDWTVGAQLLILSGNGLSSFAFISNDMLLLGMSQNPSHYTDRKGDGDEAHLVICDIKATSNGQKTDANTLAVVCRLQFPPELRNPTILRRLSIDASPCLRDRKNGLVMDPHSMLRFRAETTSSFYADATNRLFVISLYFAMRITIDLSSANLFQFFAPLSTFQKQVDEMVGGRPDIVRIVPRSLIEMNLSESSCSGSVPWDHWGPNDTRLIHTPSRLYDVDDGDGCFTSGLRYVRRIPGSPLSLEILDFNGRRLRRQPIFTTSGTEDMPVEAGEEWRQQGPTAQVMHIESSTVTQPTRVRITRGNFEIETCLPYSRTILHMDRPICNAMISEEHLVLEVEDDDKFTVLSF